MRITAVVLVFLMAFSAFAGGSSETTSSSSGSALKLGMVTDSGTIDDRSFNQGIWEGIQRAAEEYGLESTYLRPVGTSLVDYYNAIADLHGAGYRFIACPGYLFADAVSQAQSEFEDLQLVIIDSEPSGSTGANTVSILFREEEAGFLAGVAAALQLKDAVAGFIGGIEFPAVQKYNWGFQQGIAYANANYGTNVTITADNVVYAGSFSDLALGQQLAGTMYDNGVDVIFACASATGLGVVDEAKARRSNGQDAWVIGVDVDQYDVGLMEDGKSVILTSAIKRIDIAAYNEAVSAYNGNFQGGTVRILGVSQDAVGIPEENPNLSAEVIAEVEKISNLISDGTIKVQDTPDGLIP